MPQSCSSEGGKDSCWVICERFSTLPAEPAGQKREWGRFPGETKRVGKDVSFGGRKCLPNERGEGSRLVAGPYSFCSLYFCYYHTSRTTRGATAAQCLSGVPGKSVPGLQTPPWFSAGMTVPVYVTGASKWREEEDAGKGEAGRLLVLDGQTER